jgi:hypothetical protein
MIQIYDTPYMLGKGEIMVVLQVGSGCVWELFDYTAFNHEEMLEKARQSAVKAVEFLKTVQVEQEIKVVR